MTQTEKKAINSAFKKIYRDNDKLESFLSLFDKKDTPADEPKPMQKVLSYFHLEINIPSQFDELVDVFRRFSGR